MIITIIRLSFSFLVRWYKNSKKKKIPLSLWFIIWNVDVDALVKPRVRQIVVKISEVRISGDMVCEVLYDTSYRSWCIMIEGRWRGGRAWKDC